MRRNPVEIWEAREGRKRKIAPKSDPIESAILGLRDQQVRREKLGGSLPVDAGRWNMNDVAPVAEYLLGLTILMTVFQLPPESPYFPIKRMQLKQDRVAVTDHR